MMMMMMLTMMIHSRFGPSNVVVGAFTPRLPSSRVGGKARAPSASRRSWGSGNQMSGSLVRLLRLRGGESPAEQVLPGVYCLVSYGVPRFNVPSESELAAEFDAHPNREEMINATDNECEAGIHPEERLLVALHNYKSAWMLRALGIEDREPDLFLDACHACACREAGIWDNGSDFSENFINRRRIAGYFQRQGQTMQRPWQLHANGDNGTNELTGRACELCHPAGIYNGSAPNIDLRAYDVESYTYTFIRENEHVEGHSRFFLQRKPKRRVRQRRHENEEKQAADERRREAMRGF